MKKVADITVMVVIIACGFMAIIGVGYGLYQQSQLYPRVHQEIGFQTCVAQVQAEQAKQQVTPEVTK
mgnify:CR=1 FL=1